MPGFTWDVYLNHHSHITVSNNASFTTITDEFDAICDSEQRLDTLNSVTIVRNSSHPVSEWVTTHRSVPDTLNRKTPEQTPWLFEHWVKDFTQDPPKAVTVRHYGVYNVQDSRTFLRDRLLDPANLQLRFSEWDGISLSARGSETSKLIYRYVDDPERKLYSWRTNPLRMTSTGSKLVGDVWGTMEGVVEGEREGEGTGPVLGLTEGEVEGSRAGEGEVEAAGEREVGGEGMGSVEETEGKGKEIQPASHWSHSSSTGHDSRPQSFRQGLRIQTGAAAGQQHEPATQRVERRDLPLRAPTPFFSPAVPQWVIEESEEIPVEVPVASEEFEPSDTQATETFLKSDDTEAGA